MDFTAFYKLVMLKSINFNKKYGVPPKFIKVPLYFTYEFIESYNDIVYFSNIETVAGLKICETPTITKLENCEVF